MATRAWREAIGAAGTHAPEWRARLAGAVRAATHGHVTAVLMCPPGDWARMTAHAHPAPAAALFEEAQRRFLPRIEQAGEGWREALRRDGPVYAPLDTGRATDIADAMRRTLLTPLGIDGYVASFMRDRNGELLGMLLVGSPQSSARLLTDHRRLLEDVGERAGTLLDHALELARSVGAELPASPTAAARCLSAREEQIARMVADGLSNLNIAARLGISHHTVGVHLKNIYATLGLHSRVDLAAWCWRR